MQQAWAERLRAIGGFEPSPRLAVAVSGGSDSMALALLAAAWVRAEGGTLVALTVDHALRPESATEAATLAAWMKARAIPHHILRWEGTKPTANIQAEARNARYRLLEGFCRDAGILHLLTGHQMEDQAESFWQRLARGSGARGLAAMPAVQWLGNVRLVRPLLDIRREALRTYLRSQNQPWLEDPSNQSDHYQRSSLRKLQPWLEQQGWHPERLSRTIHSLATTRAAMDPAFWQIAVETVNLTPEAIAIIPMTRWQKLTKAEQAQLATALMATFSGQTLPPRHQEAERLVNQLGQGAKAATLHGCEWRFHPKTNHLLVVRQLSAMAPPVPMGECWDGRFISHPYAAKLGACTQAAYQHAMASPEWQHHPLSIYGNRLLWHFPCRIGLEESASLPHITGEAQSLGLVFSPSVPLTSAGFVPTPLLETPPP